MFLSFICEILLELINKIFKDGVDPRYKIDDLQLKENYRPVALLPTVSEIVEVLNHNMLLNKLHHLNFREISSNFF